MNKRDREQLRASIAKDLIEGQGGSSPTRELLRQYAPLEGIITSSAPEESSSRRHPEPEENSMAGGATVARNEEPAWHGAKVAQDAGVAQDATQAVRRDFKVGHFQRDKREPVEPQMNESILSLRQSSKTRLSSDSVTVFYSGHRD